MHDLAVSDFYADSIRSAALVGVHVPMHTATRMAEPVLGRVRELLPDAHICAFGRSKPPSCPKRS